MRRLLFALPFVITGACTYDWTVGPADGGSSGGVSEAGTGADTSTAADASNDNSAQCDGLMGQIGLARAQILSCTTTCDGSVTNECGCTLPVADPQSSGAKAYTSAVAAYKNAGCVADCSSGCQTVRHVCFQGGVCT